MTSVLKQLEINRGANTCIGQSGIGYIVVPNDKIRQEYIDNCYRNCTVTIDGGYGYSFIENVPIPLDILQKIEFPKTEEETGSRVYWVRENTFNRPIIVGLLNELDEPNDMMAGQNRYVQVIDGRVVEIFFDATTSMLNISVSGDSENPSKINLISNTDENSEINVSSSGKIKVSAKNIIVNAFKDAVFTLKKNSSKELLKIECDETQLHLMDQFENEITLKDGEIDIVSEKINHNKGKEPMVLGSTLKGILSELIDAIMAITVVSPAGPTSVPSNAAQFAEIKGKLDTILSKISNLE